MVRVGAAPQLVEVHAADDEIVAGIAVNLVVADLAKEEITLVASVQCIVAVPAVDLINTALSPHSILPAASENPIPAVAGMDVATFPRETRTQCLGVRRAVYFRKLRYQFPKVSTDVLGTSRHGSLHLLAVDVRRQRACELVHTH